MKKEIKEKFNFFVRTHRKIGILIDSIKGFCIALILFTFIVFLASAIIHNILRIVEASNEYSGKYKKLYVAGDGMMNIYEEGDGYRTLIILPGIGTSSPVLKYKALANSLEESGYKVVIAEPLGYGYSLSSKKERTSKNIVNEIREALQNAKIDGPYVFLTFENSNIYANYYAKNFPDEVLGIVSINGLYSESLKNETFKDKYLPNIITNIKFYSAIAFSGLIRWNSYINPSDFQIDKMQASDSYSKEDLKLYRNRLANKYLTKEMRKEAKKLFDNLKELEDYKYSENLTTLQIITETYRDEYLDRQENISKYATNMITNNNIQKVRTIEGKIEDYLYSKNKIKELKNLIGMYF